MKKTNIVLVGMPGSGKSTVGVLLAKMTAYGFIDTDLVIQQKEGQRLQDIIDRVGSKAFLEIENRDIAALGPVNHTVIATGGSAVFGRDAMARLSSDGYIVYLRVSDAEILRRISKQKDRGIAMEKGETLDDVYRKRCPVYEACADIIVDCGADRVEDNAMAVIEALSAVAEAERLNAAGTGEG